MTAALVARSSLTDVSTTSEALALLSAVARELDETYFQLSELARVFDLLRAEGEDLDERAAIIQPAALTRSAGRRAEGGAVVFTRVTASGAASLQPGIVVQTADGRQYRTTQATSVAPDSPERLPGNGPGVDFAPVSVLAVELGAESNAPAGTITGFAQRPQGIASVTNTTSLVTGASAETDEAFRARILQTLQALAKVTPAALEANVVGITDETTGAQVLAALFVEDPITPGEGRLYIDDGSGEANSARVSVSGEELIAAAAGGEEFLQLAQSPLVFNTLSVSSTLRGDLELGVHYKINPVSAFIRFDPVLQATEKLTADYEYYTGLIAVVQRRVEEEFRGQGVLIRVLAPTPKTIQWDVSISTVAGVSRERNLTLVAQALSDYIAELNIGEDVIVAEAIERMMRISGMSDVTISIPTQTRISISESERAVTSPSQIVVR